MFYYFPGNYRWSSAFTLALMAGGHLNQMHRWLAPLRDTGPEPDTTAWAKAWDCMGEEQSRHAAAERARLPAGGRRPLFPRGHVSPDG